MSTYVLYGGELYNYNELYHHGVKGQKWGVRRYQNPDGSLTAAGRKRRKSGNTAVSESERQHLSEKARRTKLTNEQTIRELSAYHRTAMDPDFDANSPAAKKYLALDKEIKEFSGDWYNGEGVSDKFKSVVVKYDSLDNACDAKHAPIVSKLRDEYQRAELETQIKYVKNPLNKVALRNDRIADYADWEQAFHKAKNDPHLKDVESRYRAASKAHSQESARIKNDYESDLLGVVLEDLGYKDSPEARRLIGPIVIWD